MFITVCLCIFLINSANCSNTTYGKYMSMDENDFRSRKSRLISFNTEDGDISVEMDFVVPFVKIPIKKSLDMTKGAIANINIGAVLLAGAATFAVSIVVPTILTFFNKKLFAKHFYSSEGLSEDSYKPYRNIDGGSSETWRYLTILDDVLMENNIDTTSCMQRIICWFVKKASTNVSRGQGSSTDKILDGLATNEWLQSYISNTPFLSALRNGLSNLNCSKEYDRCKVTERTVNRFVKNFVQMMNVG